ncbi:MAG: hypothetical protein F4X66_14410 [Chloroflexi bacterium]|nr:hypothetical protein [Chloroflexota bacterium]MYE42268.1 hypothetical protein [Chloroflexota bacterium]
MVWSTGNYSIDIIRFLHRTLAIARENITSKWDEMMPRLYILTLPASLFLAGMLIACAGENGRPAAPTPPATVGISTQAADTLVPAPTDTPTPEPTNTPVPTRAPTVTQAPAPASSPTERMAAAKIYAMLSQSVAYIETPIGTGSGFLVEGGYVVTNHHVVWPFEEARVVFPDGAELTAPVAAWDPVSDTAVLGPLNVDAPPLEMRDGEDLAVGSELFLLGYPGESEPFPEPTIVSGVLSQYRQWDQPGITYFQTDAVIAGGQSGGVLVNRRGEVIGISGLSITEAEYALVASAADLEPLVRQLIQGQDPWGVGNRSFSENEASLEFSANLKNHWDSAMFMLDAGSARVVEFEIDSLVPASFRLADPWGNVLLDVDNGLGGNERGSMEVSPEGHHFLTVKTTPHGPVDFDIGSSVELLPFSDPDDGGRLGLRGTVAGSIDYPGDRDWYSLRLEEGDTVRIRSDSWLVDTTLHIDFLGSYANQVAYDDDSGGGLFGTNSELVYQAPMTGEYLVVVHELDGDDVGGYFLSAHRAPSSAGAFVVPPGPPEVDSPFGKMVVLESPLTGHSVQMPAAWTHARPGDADSGFIFQAVAPERGGFAQMMEFDLSESNEEQSLEEFVEAIRESLSQSGFPLLYEELSAIPSGDPRAVLEFQNDDGPGTWQVLLTMKGERYLLLVQYGLRDDESYRDLVDYSFGTLMSSGLLSSPNFGQYFQGRRLHVSVVSLERLPELRYSTIDPDGAVRQWALFPSSPDSELILARLKVENHTVDRITINVLSSVAELRDAADRPHNPVAIAETVWQDFRGEPEALVRVDEGDCFDGNRALIEPGTAVRWQSEADATQYLAFEDASVAIGPNGRAELPPGRSLSHVFNKAGTYRYACGDQSGSERTGIVRVMPAGDRASVATRSVEFLEGQFELLKGYGLDGYLVFDVPAGSEFQALRWLAGDSINIPF